MAVESCATPRARGARRHGSEVLCAWEGGAIEWDTGVVRVGGSIDRAIPQVLLNY